MEKTQDKIDFAGCRRRDRLTAQRIDVGLVFLEMLSAVDAVAYLQRCKIPAHISERVLAGKDERRRDGDCWLNNS